MNTLLETLTPNLFRKSEVAGVKPLAISKVLSPDETMSRRTSDISKFFGGNENDYTYKKFKATIGNSNVFGYGADTTVKSVASVVETTDEKGDARIVYDEYIETFFIYLYYQLFVKLFSNHEKIISANQSGINNAKDLLSGIPESIEPDVEENLVNLYRSFYSMFSLSITDPKKIGTNTAAQGGYVEDFIRQNIRLFIDYPLSIYMQDSSSMNNREFIDALFDAVNGINPENTGNRQIMTIRVLSDFVRNNQTVDFDVVNFQDLTKKYPSFVQGQNAIKFPSKSESIISDMINELSSIDDLDDIEMGWAKGTNWEPYIKMICGIVCIEEVSNSVKKVAKTVRKEKALYQQKIDVAEQDGGVYFINSQAFYEASSRVEKFKDLIPDMNNAIKDVAKKTLYFQSKEGNDLIKNMFVEYDKSAAAIYYDKLDPKQQKSIETLMRLTELMTTLGSNFSDAVAQINFILLGKDNTFSGSLSKRNEEALLHAMNNVGDFTLNQIDEDDLSYFNPRRVYTGLKEIASNTYETFTKIFSGSDPFDFSIDKFVNAFNETFGEDLDFANMKKNSSGNYYIEMYGESKIEFKNLDELKAYIGNMCISMGSIIYHSKFKFSKKGSEESRYNSYFNVLSWFIKSLNEYGKGRSLGAPQFPFVYLVTPFFLEFVKYSFRAFVNDIEDVLNEAGFIDDEFRDKIKASHKMKTMEEDEWKPMVEKLAQAIEEYLKKQ
jgi:hypothetical protein